MRWTSPAGLGLLAAFMLPILVLAVVSIVSIRQRAETRRLLVEEQYGRIADLVSAGLSESMVNLERELLAELDAGGWSERQLIESLHKADHAFPALRPFLMLAPDGRVVFPVRARERNRQSAWPSELIRLLPDGDQYTWLFADGEKAEFERGDYALAERAFRRAAAASTSKADRIRALNAVARTQRKAGRAEAAVETYARMTELADPFDAELSRWAVIARLQRSMAIADLGDADKACDSKFDALSYLLKHRFDLDPDVYDFYRAETERAIRDHELTEEQIARLDDLLAGDPNLANIEAALGTLLRQAVQLADLGPSEVRPVAVTDVDADPDGGERLAVDWSIFYFNLQADPTGATVVAERANTGWRLLSRWRPESVQAVLTEVLAKPGSWRNSGVALIDPAAAVVFANVANVPDDRVAARVSLAALPGWQVVAFPRGGSLASVARQSVFDYAVLLAAAFLAVVGGLLLATRTISREVALARTRSDFVSNVSHELKTPLALIRMFAENLRAGWVPEAKKDEYYTVMVGESERLSGVIDNVLDFSRMESGRREFRFRSTDIGELVSDIVDRYQYSFETAGIDLSLDMPETPVVARVDRDAISQVVVNLLSNAAKYIGEGQKQVVVSVRDNSKSLQLTVTDTGVGMSRDALGQIFSPFVRINDPEVRSVAGSGIGLTIVRHIVEAHRGSIEVESEEQRGSVFTVTLPHDPERRLGLSRATPASAETEH